MTLTIMLIVNDKKLSSIKGIDRKMQTSKNFVPVIIRDKTRMLLPQNTRMNVPVLHRNNGSGPNKART
jgi:hypothetical protein